MRSINRAIQGAIARARPTPRASAYTARATRDTRFWSHLGCLELPLVCLVTCVMTPLLMWITRVITVIRVIMEWDRRIIDTCHTRATRVIHVDITST